MPRNGLPGVVDWGSVWGGSPDWQSQTGRVWESVHFRSKTSSVPGCHDPRVPGLSGPIEKRWVSEVHRLGAPFGVLGDGCPHHPTSTLLSHILVPKRCLLDALDA